MKIMNLITISLMLIMIVSCSNETKTEKPTYVFTAKLVSAVAHKGEIIDSIPIVYTIQVKDLELLDNVFDKYNSQFIINDEYKHVRLSKETIIRKSNGELIDITAIEKNSTITFSVELFDDEYNLLAKEIVLSDD